MYRGRSCCRVYQRIDSTRGSITLGDIGLHEKSITVRTNSRNLLICCVAFREVVRFEYSIMSHRPHLTISTNNER